MTSWLLGGAVVILSACTTPSEIVPGSTAYTGPPPTYTSSPTSSSQPRTATPGSLSQANRPPDAQVLYQRRASDSFGSRTYTSSAQVSGPISEEIHIGNQQVDPYQPIYRPRTIDGVVQPGYVPNGTTMVYDPRTGRMIPVR